jgi:hypothetical protein
MREWAGRKAVAAHFDAALEEATRIAAHRHETITIPISGRQSDPVRRAA